MKQTIEVDVKRIGWDTVQLKWPNGFLTIMNEKTAQNRGIKPPEATYKVEVELTESEVKAMRTHRSDSYDEYVDHQAERVIAQHKLREACSEIELPE